MQETMDPAAEERRFVWQPVTLTGVAGFAHAPLGRLLLVQLLVAIVCAAAIMWATNTTCFPVARQAIEKLPAKGEIRDGLLGWGEGSPQALAANRFLAIAVDAHDEGTVRSPAHVQVEFHRRTVRVHSLLGYVELAYPRMFIFSFNRTELVPWWGAWSPAILALIGMGVVAGLLVTWACLGTVYCCVPLLVGYFLNRDLRLAASWRLAGAALLPGALFMSLSVVWYAVGLFDLLRLAAAAGLHLLIPWIYLLLAPLKVPYAPGTEPLKANPFVPGARADDRRDR